MMKGRYAQELLDHFQRPRNTWNGSEVPGLRKLQCGEPEKGDVIVLYIVADDRTGEISHCWFRASGSVETIGIASWVTMYATGKPVREVRRSLEPAAREALGLSPNQWRVTKWLSGLFDKLNEEMQI